MCGIAGIVGGRWADAEAASAQAHALRHRGPDGEGVRAANGAALVHRRLSIIDLEGGRQPIGNEDGTRWIVCNGEIYNYKALTAELEAKGHRFRTRSDTEVILHLYEEMGERCLERLRGMFAFAIWDEGERRLFAARDHLGQKPLFYRHAGDELAFASEIKGLVPLLPGRPELDPAALHQYLSLRVIAPPLTMFRGVAKLPPAHSLTFSEREGLRIRRYWDLAYEPKLRGSEEELLDGLEERLVEAVRLHLVSDVPVGAFLSGGLDSTLVLALATKHGAAPPPTFTIGVPYGGYDEAPYARMVAERYATAHHEETVVPSLVENLPDLVYHLDEPSDPLSVCTYLISRMARRHVKVVLGGDGGDELFGGYDRYYGNLYAGRYARLVPGALRRGVVSPLLGLIPDGDWYKSKGHQVKWLHRASFMSGGERYAQTLGYFYVTPERRDGLYGPELRRAARGLDAYAPVREAYERAQAEHPVDRMLYADSQIRLPDHSVMILDRTSMAHGLEARSPFMDHEVAAFCASLPTEMKVRWRTLRYAQQRLCERHLPREVLARKKQGFASALPYLLRDEYRQLFDRLLRRSELARAGHLEQAGVDRLLGEHASGRADHGNRLWLLLNAEAWHRMHVGGASRDELAGQIAARGGDRPAAPAEPRAA